MFLPQMGNSETRVVWAEKFAQSSFTFAFEAVGQKNWDASCWARKRPKVWVNKEGNKWNHSNCNKTHFFLQLFAIWLFQVLLEKLPNVSLFLLLLSSRNDSEKTFYANPEISFIIILFSLLSASFLLVSLSWLNEIFTINFHATLARQVGEETFPHLLSELLRLPSPSASFTSNLNSTHYTAIHGRTFFSGTTLWTKILITRRHRMDGFSLHVDFRPLSFSHFFCCVLRGEWWWLWRRRSG